MLLETDPDTVREPDIAYVSAERLPTVILTMDDTLDGGDVLPGFICPVREILG